MQDTIYSEEFPYKCNAITLMEDNPKLKKLCLKSRGKYIHVNYNDKVEEFENM